VQSKDDLETWFTAQVADRVESCQIVRLHEPPPPPDWGDCA
jgi:hypothetical protein